MAHPGAVLSPAVVGAATASGDVAGAVTRRSVFASTAPPPQERAFGRHVFVSIALHLAAVMALAALAVATEPRRPTEMPIELVSVAPPLPPPQTSPPPRAIVKPLPPPPAPTPAPRPGEAARRAEAPPNALDTAPRPAPEPPTELVVPRPAASAPPVPASVAGGPSGGSASPRGELLASTNLDSAGSGVPGPDGSGASPRGMSAPAPAAPSAPSGAASLDHGITALARPLGGYQVKPAYPERARRARIGGVTLLRFLVLATGRVGPVAVAESAGHGDLDRAAVDAVKQWRFEPARRGSEAVDVWVTLPVRFELAR